VFLANILNNQPMTILMAQVALEPGYIQAIAEHTGELGDNSVAASQLGASNSTISGVSMPQASAINQVCEWLPPSACKLPGHQVHALVLHETGHRLCCCSLVPA
jgi:hypothetical protein